MQNSSAPEFKHFEVVSYENTYRQKAGLKAKTDDNIYHISYTESVDAGWLNILDQKANLTVRYSLLQAEQRDHLKINQEMDMEIFTIKPEIDLNVNSFKLFSAMTTVNGQDMNAGSLLHKKREGQKLTRPQKAAAKKAEAFYNSPVVREIFDNLGSIIKVHDNLPVNFDHNGLNL